MSAAHGNWPSDDQVFALNEKFGWMIKADAQSDQSRAFAQAAIDKHECIRKAAPELLEALKYAAEWINSTPHGNNCFVSSHYEGDPGDRCNCGRDSVLSSVEEVINKAEGEQA